MTNGRLGRVLAGSFRLLILAQLTPSGATAQSPEVRVQGRLQVHYRYSAGEATSNYDADAVNNGFDVRRLRIRTSVRLRDNVNLMIQPSFEMGKLRMRDAYMCVGIGEYVRITLGQEKSPFQRYELTSSNSLPSIERGLRIRGLSGFEALNDVLVNNGYGSHDIGAFLDVASPDGRFTVRGGVQNGSRESASDVNNAKSFFGRVTATVLADSGGEPLVRIGGSIAARDRAICSVCTGSIAFHPDSSWYTTAFGADLEIGGFRGGPHVVADFATGDIVPLALRVNDGRNTGNVTSSAPGNFAKFWGVHAVASYRIVTTGSDRRLVTMVEPAFRVDVTNTDTRTPNTTSILLTPVVNVHFSRSAVLRAGVDVFLYDDAAGARQTAGELKVAWQASF